MSRSAVRFACDARSVLAAAVAAARVVGRLAVPLALAVPRLAAGLRALAAGLRALAAGLRVAAAGLRAAAAGFLAAAAFFGAAAGFFADVDRLAADDAAGLRARLADARDDDDRDDLGCGIWKLPEAEGVGGP
jgi:hypothetical protein